MSTTAFFDASARWINEPAAWHLANDQLHVVAEAATDFFIDEDGPSHRASAHFFSRTVAGDFDFSFRAQVAMASPYDSTCLMVMADDTHWAKLCYENWPTGPSIVSVVTQGYSDDCPSHIIGPCMPWLRVVRAKNSFGFFYSLDRKDWPIARYFNLKSEGPVRLGIAFQCPTGTSCAITVSDVRFEARPMASAKQVAD